jgi:transposase-like protein
MTSETPKCPRCGSLNPAVQNRSDYVVSMRCDVCKYEWAETQSRAADKELPPVPAIDAQGG